MKRWPALAAWAAAAAGPASLPGQEHDGRTLRGAWEAQTYRLAEGVTHEVRGRIFFTEREWTVLFFVMDADGRPRRGSGEGGTYTLLGDRLTFTHAFHLSAGGAMPGLPASELRMAAGAPGTGATEACTIEMDGDRLTVAFPSGNTMTFRRRL